MAVGTLMSCKGCVYVSRRVGGSTALIRMFTFRFSLVELIVLNVGLSAGILDSRVFSMFVFMAVILTVVVRLSLSPLLTLPRLALISRFSPPPSPPDHSPHSPLLPGQVPRITRCQPSGSKVRRRRPRTFLDQRSSLPHHQGSRRPQPNGARPSHHDYHSAPSA